MHSIDSLIISYSLKINSVRITLQYGQDGVHTGVVLLYNVIVQLSVKSFSNGLVKV